MNAGKRDRETSPCPFCVSRPAQEYIISEKWSDNNLGTTNSHGMVITPGI
jgi:hypothetical protein